MKFKGVRVDVERAHNLKKSTNSTRRNIVIRSKT
jgi:hypothetical protein